MLVEQAAASFKIWHGVSPIVDEELMKKLGAQMLLVGITGSIGMGKSTVANMFKDHGFGVYNADDTVHYIYENDEEVISKIETKFPGTINNLSLIHI